MSKHQGIISHFARHRVAANLLMLLLLIVGAFSLYKLNTQFLPTIDLNFITVSAAWPGASANDVETSVINPVEKELRDLDSVKEIKSVAREGSATITIEFVQGADMPYALDQVNDRIAAIRNLPQDLKTPIISRTQFYEPIVKLLLIGGKDVNELRQRAYFYERQLLDRGVSKINITGLPNEEIAIQIPAAKLAELHLSLDKVAQIIRQRSQDVPSGTIGKYESGRQLRATNKRRTEQEFSELPVITDNKGQLVRLSDIATITRRALDNEVTLSHHGQPAVQLDLLRPNNANALKAAKIYQEWLKEIKPTLPKGLKIVAYDQRWTFIKQRIDLLLKNGLGGFILINIILFIMLNRRIAFWVSMGIPISLLAAMSILLLAGGSINMISMFAFIMTLGIIVDDTIVVAEEALTQMTEGKEVINAIEIGAHKMLPPIAASSLTTIAAFLPLMFISAIMGKVLFEIPLVVICVIIASLVECFLVLPGHLHHSLKKSPPNEGNPHSVRKLINEKFNHFKNNFFKKTVSLAVENYATTLSIASALFLISVGLVATNRINFSFFPQPESKTVYANIEFYAGTPASKIASFTNSVENALKKTNTELSKKDKPVVEESVLIKNKLTASREEAIFSRGEEFATIFVELTEPDDRKITNKEFIQTWKKHLTIPPEVENFSVSSPRVGPPGEDIDIKISGTDWVKLKAAAEELKKEIERFPGASEARDNLPFGQEQIIFDISTEGKALGLTTESVGKQLRAAFNGEIVQIFHEPSEEVEVRVVLPDEERYRLKIMESLPILTPAGLTIPLPNAINTHYKRSLNILRHTNTLPTVHVTAEVDNSMANANNILNQLQGNVLPNLEKKYGVIIQLKGTSEEQALTLQDMKIGAAIALVLIYIILAWVFNSYTLPSLIMLTIPFGLTGAILGHLIMGLDLTILSLFGVFGLSGIVINDSIILVNRYIQIRHEFENVNDAIIESSCQRLRAVLLTSLTTIAGLTPLLFETSIQAQILIPMAVSISFGLMLSTVLILVVVPSLLVAHQKLRNTLWGSKN